MSHDLASVGSLFHRLAILHRGKIFERGPVTGIFEAPEHEFTRRLLGAIPRPDALARLSDRSPGLVGAPQ